MRSLILAALLCATPLAAQTTPGPGPVTIIHAGRLIARADRPAEGLSTITVRGGRVERVERGLTPPPPGAAGRLVGNDRAAGADRRACPPRLRPRGK